MLWRRCLYVLLLCLLMMPAGCTTGKKKRSAGTIKKDVAASFEKVKEAIGAVQKGNTELLWDLLAEESKEQAAKKAKAFRTEFAKKDKEEQADLAQQYGATAEEIRDKLSGYGYFRLMRERFYARYWMVAEAPVDHITPDADDEATVYYTRDDAEHEKKSMLFVLEDGQWRAVLSIP